MNRHDLKLLLNKKPFAPFRMTVSTNESFDVHHPELAFVTDRFVSVGKTMREGDERTILMYWVSYQHIIHIHRLSE